MKTNKKHRGDILQQVVKANGIKIKLLMTKMGYNRTSFYNHIKDESLDIEIIKEYAKAIPYDFSIEFPEMINYYVEEPEPDHYETLPAKELVKLVKAWKDKYFMVLEENRNLRIQIEEIARIKR